MTGVGVKIEGVTKKFGSVTAVDNLSLEIKPGELFTLLGPSGCGKTTLLRTIAGFYYQESGAIYFNDKRIDGIPPHKRDTGMVFQSYAVFPFMSVFDNIAYGLRARRVTRHEIKERVMNAIELVRLSGMEKRRPDQLSGGQQQRVAVARAIVIEPRVLLMDEPLSNLDAKLRVEMRVDIRRLQKKLGITMIYVTHDQEEALAISDRIAVMAKGRIVQIGTPWEIYHKPASPYVADFIGVTNFFECRVVSQTENSVVVLFQNRELRLRASFKNKTERVVASIRPEALRLKSDMGDLGGKEEPVFSFKGKVLDSVYLGSSISIICEAEDGTNFQVSVANPVREALIDEGSTIEVVFATDDMSVFPVEEMVGVKNG